MACCMIAMAQKDDTKLKILYALAAGIMAVHFYGLGLMFSVMSCLVGMICNISSIWLPKRFAIVFIPFYLLQPLFMPVDHWVQMLPLLAGTMIVLAMFSQHNMRSYLLTGNIAWLANNLYAGSVGGVMCECINIALNVYRDQRLRIIKTAV